jgi:hypothetical protein
MSGGHSLHKQDWLKIGGGLAAAAAVPFLMPEMAGALGMGGLLGGTEGGAGEAASAGLLGTLGSMGPEQAGILAAQNAGLGLGADSATLAAANTAGGGNATLGAQIGNYAGAMNKGLGAYTKAQTAINAFSSPAQQTVSAMPRQYSPGPSPVDPMPTTPFSPADPVWQAWLRKHGQGSGAYIYG